MDYLQIDLDVNNKSTLDTFMLLNNTVLFNSLIISSNIWDILDSITNL